MVVLSSGNKYICQADECIIAAQAAVKRFKLLTYWQRMFPPACIATIGQYSVYNDLLHM